MAELAIALSLGERGPVFESQQPENMRDWPRYLGLYSEQKEMKFIFWYIISE